MESNLMFPPNLLSSSVSQLPFKRSILIKSNIEKDKPKYTSMHNIGKGAFGVVYCAQAQDGSLVAIKKVVLDERFKNRELSILQSINHPNCLTLKDNFYSKSNDNKNMLNLVTELMPESLKHYLDYCHSTYQPINPLLTKIFAYQLFSALAYLHSKGIAHRDIKTDNVLIDRRSGILKICDFGSAKMLESNVKSVSYIASRIYRAPELLLGCTSYSFPIDIWASGCVISEILLDSTPMFQGSSNEDQLVQILQVIGMPSQEDLRSFECSIKCPKIEQIATIDRALPLTIDKDLLELLQKIFNFNPTKRPTAVECMRSPYFDELFHEGTKLPNGRSLPRLVRL